VPIDLVIFDCDGVLVDSERIAVPIDAHVLRELGWTLTEAEVVERFVGRSQGYMVGEIERVLGRPLPVDWEDGFAHLYQEAFDADLGPVDGIVEAIEAIELPACVASSSSHARLQYSLGRVGLFDRFRGRIFSADDVEHGKPAPDLFLHAAAALGADPRRCAVVEDSPYGLQAARAAGMRGYAYAGGLVARERLAGPGTTIFDDMRELADILRAA
jgi:HAD superfamily hydrolase (TIGR01509 family)